MNEASERIDVRTSPAVKELIVRAASTAGMSVSAFLLSAAQERAQRLLADQESLTLSAADWQAFVAALDSLDKPRPRLSAAMARHREWESAKS
jgi:uncharacterized protein (DUF1778 family)